MDEIEYYKYTMPLDNLFLIGNHAIYSNVVFNRKFAWFPHRCKLSNRIIWLQMAQYVTEMWISIRIDGPIYENYWHHDHEHLIWLLKK